MTEGGVSPRFQSQVGNLLRHFRARTADCAEADLPTLAEELENIAQAVRYGIGLPGCAAEAAELAYHCFNLVERQGNFGAWRALLEHLIAQLPQGRARVRLANHVALLHRLDGRVTTAVAQHEALLAEAEALGLAVEAAYIAFNLGYDCSENHDYRQAQRYAQEAAVRGAALPELPPHFHAAVANLQGLIHLHTGNGAQALPLFGSAAAQWEESGRPTYAARALINMAQAAEALRDYAQALALYDRAETLLAAVGNRLDRQLIAVNRGTNYFLQERWELALGAYLSADFAFLRRIGHRRYQAMLATNIGDVALQLGQWEAAETHLLEAISLWRSLEDAVMLANALGTLGKLYARQGNAAAAAGPLDEALALLARYPDNAWAAELQRDFAQLRRSLEE